MADVFGIGTLIGSAISSGLNYASQQEANQTNRRIARENLQFQREQLDYQKALQQQIFAREDTAHQREINDLRQAGINPLATANGGTGANAGAVVNTEAMHNDYNQQPVQIDPSAFLQAAAQMEATRNNKATEKLEQTKIESEETIKLMDLEEKRYEAEQDMLYKRLDLAERTRNNNMINEIQKQIVKNQEQYNETMKAHLERTDSTAFKEYTLRWNRFQELEIPQEIRQKITDELNNEETRQKIDAIRLDNEKKPWEKRKLIYETLSEPIKDMSGKADKWLDMALNALIPWY